MKGFKYLVAISVLTTVPAVAQQWNQPQRSPAQGLPLTGAWTESSMSPQGMITATVDFDANGNYVMVATQNGQFMRQWGKFDIKQTSHSSAHINLHIADYAPRQVCTQMPGVQGNCIALPPSRVPVLDANFTSPSSFSAQGMAFQRDQQAQLLQVQVPATLMHTLAAPPTIHTPTLHPYQTPGGAGSVGAMKYDDEHQQPYRVCGVTGGTVYQTNDGVEHCSTQ